MKPQPGPPTQKIWPCLLPVSIALRKGILFDSSIRLLKQQLVEALTLSSPEGVFMQQRTQSRQPSYIRKAGKHMRQGLAPKNLLEPRDEVKRFIVSLRITLVISCGERVGRIIPSIFSPIPLLQNIFCILTIHASPCDM